VPGVELMRVESSMRLWRRYHETYTICTLVDSDGLEWRCARERNCAVRGDVLFARPGDLTVSTSLAGANSFVSLMLPPALMEEAATEFGLRRRPSWRAAQMRDPVLFAKLRRCQESLDKTDDLSGTQAGFAEMLALLFVRCVERRAIETTAPRPNVWRIRDYLHANHQHPFRLDDLAIAVGLSRYHLTRAFSAEFGVTPHAYVLQLRLAKAKDLLARDVPLRQIAAETGFADQSHFTRHFRKSYGVTPVQYLRSVHNN
jgi:AraC-like DNA-binding protein